MTIEQTDLPTEHLLGIKIDAIADFDGSIQLETIVKLTGEVEINGIDYNFFINDLRTLLQKYQK